MNAKQWIRQGLWVEPFLALVVAGGLIRVIWHIFDAGYLPQPFFYEISDVWMDWFNTAAWANDKGVYDSWGTLYPPLTFLILKIFRVSWCYTDYGGYFNGALRDCDWVGVATLHGIYVLNIVLISAIYMRVDRRTALPRAFALAAGLPMLTAMERGNIMVLCFTFFVLAYGPLLKSARLRWMAAGITLNFKLYLLGALFPQLLKRRWRWFEGALISTIVIYVVTYAMLGMGTPKEIYDNIVSYTITAGFSPLDLWAAVTYNPMNALLYNFPLSGFIGSGYVDILGIVVPWSMTFTKLIILIAVAMAWMRPEAVPMYRLTNLGILFALISQETGGYTPIFFIFLTFMEPWKGWGRKIAIIACYIVSFQFDIIIDRILYAWNESYLTGRTVYQTYYLMIGFFIRPAFYLIIAASLASVTIREVWGDIRDQSWKTRWRLRRDVPVLAGGGEARQPI